MKKILVLLSAVLLVLGTLFVLGLTGAFGEGSANLLSSMISAKPRCATIQSASLTTDDGTPATNGQDQWGYNYVANQFNGKFCDAYKNADWCQEYKEVNLLMKWNDAWLSNKDCDKDGILDRHYGFESYLGSGAWVTNHLSGTYTGANGESCAWDYSIKIVATPRGCLPDGNCYEKDNTLIGRQIWGDFAVTQEVLNDPCAGYEGLLYKSEAVGLGLQKP